MSAPNSSSKEAPSRTRFAYHGEEPEEGGVRSVRPPQEGTSPSEGDRGSSPSNHGGHRGHGPVSPSLAGVPGPEERQLDISELLRNIGMRYTHHFRIPAGREDELETVQPIEGEVTLTNTGGILLLRGQAKTTLQMECGRCLTPTDIPVDFELSEDFGLVTANNAFRQEDVQAVDENVGGSVITGNGHVLDLGDLLRQNLLLTAPPKPLCREDCPGVIPGIIQTEPEPGTEEPAPADDNPLRHLAEMLEAKRRAEAGETVA